MHHCSFTPNGGSFPPHCIQGTKGYDFQKDIGDRLATVRSKGANVVIGFKGIENGHECFSAFRYTESSGKERFGSDFQPSEWCDCYALESSALAQDIDAQPDVMAVTSKQSIKDKLSDLLMKPDCRLFVCGLAFDFCVIDSAINARENTGKPTFIIHDATRAAQIPGATSFGSGFLTDPAELVKKLENHGISMIDLC